MKELPVHEIREELLEAIGAGKRVMLKAPTGSGKSTAVPQMLLDRVEHYHHHPQHPIQ